MKTPNLILFEGPDFSGKTSLIEQIREPNDTFYHNGVFPSPQHAYDEYTKQLNDHKNYMISSFGNEKTIIDRSFLAEQIYGPVMRDEHLEKEQYSELIAEFKALNGLLIVCLAPLEVSLTGWESRIHEEYVKEKEDYINIWTLYYDFLCDYCNGRDIIHYDFTLTKEYINANSH